MIGLTQSLSHYLWENHRDIVGLVMLGHTELVTGEIWNAYIEWCKTEDGRKYLKGGAKYDSSFDA